jgi:hypothetical protein
MISWLIELISTALSFSFSYLHSLGLHHLHYPDCILMNIIIPLCHLMNDEETKGIISEENWYQGFRHMLGLYEQEKTEQPNRNQRNRYWIKYCIHIFKNIYL